VDGEKRHWRAICIDTAGAMKELTSFELLFGSRFVTSADIRFDGGFNLTKQLDGCVMISLCKEKLMGVSIQ
jgi:hypothetical protein